MRLLVVCNDVPLPTNTGGRVDVWRRLTTLAQGGHTLALLCWHDVGRSASPDADVLAAMHTVCEQVRVASITRTAGEALRRLLVLWRMPSHAGSRWVTTRSMGLPGWAKAFRPDAVMLDGLYGGAVAAQLAKALGVPLLYRSHNIEHAYMRGQLALERHWPRRLGLLANCFGLKRFERQIHRAAKRVFDISPDDRQRWIEQGSNNIDWLPTLVDAAFAARIANSPRDATPIDVLYFGNLNTPNNVEAVCWLLREVLPRVASETIRVVVAGSRPNALVRQAVAGDARVELVEDPLDMAPLIGAARVIVNPMQAGSGVNLKSVEMLFSDAALVSTSLGVKGLPTDAKAVFSVADDAEGFARALASALAQDSGPVPSRVSLRRTFAGTSMAAMIAASLHIEATQP